MFQSPYFYDGFNTNPKHKFKFIVEFGPNSVISKIYSKNQYQYLIKSITKPKPTIDTADANNVETRTWFGNVPDPTKRNIGTVSWTPITIKFIDTINRYENFNFDEFGDVENLAVRSVTPYAPPDDETIPPATDSPSNYSEYDLEHFFSRMVEDMDSSMFGGSAPKPHTWGVGTYDKPENTISAWMDTLTPEQKIFYSTATQQERLDIAKGFGYLYVGPNNFSTKGDTASTIDKSTNCKTSMDSYIKASCVYFKFFGDIKIYDLVTTPVIRKSQSQTIANGYWTLRNPWIKSVDFGNNDYSSDELQEYSVEIAYESARYIPIKY